MDEEFRRLERQAAHDPVARQALRQARRRRGLCPAGAHTLGFRIDEDGFRLIWTPPTLMGEWSWDLESARLIGVRGAFLQASPLEVDILEGLQRVLNRWARDGRPSCNVLPTVRVLEDQTGLALQGTCVEGCEVGLNETLVIDPEARWGSRVPLRTRITQAWRDVVELVVQRPAERFYFDLVEPIVPFVAGPGPRFAFRRRETVVLYADLGMHWCEAQTGGPGLSKPYATHVRVEGDRALPRMRPCPSCALRW